MTDTEHRTKLVLVSAQLRHLRALNSEIRSSLREEEWDVVSELLRVFASEAAQTSSDYEAAFTPSKRPAGA